MAQRYGGKYSPDGSEEQAPAERPAFRGAQVDPVGGKSNILFIPAVVLVFTSLNGGALKLSLGLAAAGALVLAAWLLREGLRAEAAFNARKVARRPAFPRKIAASLLTGIGVGLATFRNEPGLIAPVLFGAVAAALHCAAFGIDPLRSKGMQGQDGFQRDRVAKAVQEAEAHLSAMATHARRAGDRQVMARVERFALTARDLFRTVEEDPRDLSGARRYLGVYLQGASDATEKYADLYLRAGDQASKAAYLTLLDDLEANFSARTQKMLLDDRSDLTVEIDVLKERLQREGIRADQV